MVQAPPLARKPGGGVHEADGRVVLRGGKHLRQVAYCIGPRSLHSVPKPLLARTPASRSRVHAQGSWRGALAGAGGLGRGDGAPDLLHRTRRW